MVNQLQSLTTGFGRFEPVKYVNPLLFIIVSVEIKINFLFCPIKSESVQFISVSDTPLRHMLYQNQFQ